MTILDIPRSGRDGAYVYYMRGRKLCRRSYVLPKDVRTAGRVRARGAFGAVVKAWSRVLSEEKRRAWNAAAAKVRSRPRLWQSGWLTGQTFFAGINSARSRIGREMLLWPPDALVFQPNPVAGLSLSEEQGRLRLKLKMVGPVDGDIMVFGAAPCSAGRKKWRNGAYLGLLPRLSEGRATSRSCMWRGMGSSSRASGYSSAPGSRGRGERITPAMLARWFWRKRPPRGWKSEVRSPKSEGKSNTEA
jgi:hypothetical protein